MVYPIDNRHKICFNLSMAERFDGAVESERTKSALMAMNPKQRTFAQAYKSGKTAGEAYLYAYDPKPSGRGEEYDQLQYRIRGTKMLQTPKIQAYLEAFRMQIERASIKSAVETCEWLTQVIDNEKNKMKDRLRAVELLSRIRGWFQDPPTVVVSQQNDGGQAQAIINIIGVTNAADLKRETAAEDSSTIIQAETV